MQRYKSAMLILGSCLSINKSTYYSCRGLSLLSRNRLVDVSDHSLVLVESKGISRTAILNRPSSLNALNTSMVAKLQKLFRKWEADPDIGFVVSTNCGFGILKGSGKAFSAGGDIVSLYNFKNEGNLEECKQLFRLAYRFVYFLANYSKPHVAILNGITMGGGAAISNPATFRVATDKTIFATPETLIGFHPDAGASYYLSRLPGYLGEYLALTGEKLNGAEMVACGLATHYTPTRKLPFLEEHLGNLATDDPFVIETYLGSHAEPICPDQSSVIHRIEVLDKCFSHDTVEEIIESLVNEAAKGNDPWCASTVNKLKKIAPLSLKVSLRSIREGRYQTLKQCLIREYRMTLQAISGEITGDFCEGVRAKLVDKDNAPKWHPANLEHVSKDMVEQYFSRLSASEPELELPTGRRKASQKF